MKKLSALLFLLWGGISVSQAQQDTTTFFGKSNHIFEHLDKGQIATGLISDYGIEFINMSDYNGRAVSRTNFTDLREWRLLYASLYSFQISAKTEMEQLGAINARIRELISLKKPITFAVMDYRYQSIREDALSRNLITVRNDQLYDVPGRSQNPYRSNRMFAVSPLNQSAFKGKNAIIFRPELFFSNSANPISSIAIDPGETGTFRTVRYNSPLEFNCPKPGFMPIAVRITYSDGSVMLGHTQLVITQLSTNSTDDPHIRRVKQTKTSGHTQPENKTITGSAPFLGKAATGNISIRFGNKNLTRTIRKPLIVIREADFEHIHRQGQSGEAHMAQYNSQQIKNRNPESMPGIPGSYDIIYLNLSDPTDYIQRNAYLLEHTIYYINSSKSTYQGKRQDNVVLGIGIGGLIARYALRDMELKNQDHQTRVFISHDAPHHGINIPAGYQAAVQHLANFTFFMPPSALSPEVRYIRWEDIFPEILDAQAAYGTPATRQLIIQRYFLNQQNQRLSADNLSYQNFFSEINTMGWPRKSNNFVMSNGSDKGVQTIPENSPILVFPGNKPLSGDRIRTSKPAAEMPLVNSIPKDVYNTGEPLSTLPFQLPFGNSTARSSLTIDFIINAVPNYGTSLLYRGNISIKRKMPFIKNPESYIMKASVRSTPDMLPLDNAPGSPLTAQTTYGHAVKTAGKIPAFISSTDRRKHESEFCFIPTVSALAIIDPWRNLKRDISNNSGKAIPGTVKEYFSPDENQDHLSYSQSSINQILQWQDAGSDDKK